MAGDWNHLLSALYSLDLALDFDRIYFCAGVHSEIDAVNLLASMASQDVVVGARDYNKRLQLCSLLCPSLSSTRSLGRQQWRTFWT